MTLPPMSLQERLRRTESMRAHGHDEAADTCELAAAELDRLQARVSELEVDAERYRWLRDGNNEKDSLATNIATHMYGLEWDAAIDTARKAKP